MTRAWCCAIALTVFGTAGDRQPAHAVLPTYDVFAISYGVLADYPVSSLVAGADRARRMDIEMVVWLLRGSDGRAILVDAGFYRDKFFKQFTVKSFVKPSEAIARVGLTPEDISDVVITHMHWDHADGVDLFPKAHVWIQKDEFTYYTGEAWHARNTHGGIDPEDVMAMVDLNLKGRVSFTNPEDATAIPGLTFHTGGRHTWASQYVSVQSKSGVIVIASDNLYLYENLDTHRPIAQTLDAEANLAAQDRMRALAASPRLIVPGHDPAVFTRFPKVAPGVVHIE